MGKKYILALDDSPHSRLATEWTGRNVPLHDDDDTLHLVTVLPPLTYAVTPAAPVATAAALVTVRHQWEAQRRHEEAHASEIVKWASSTLQTLQVPSHKVHSHILTPAGGASGVAESIVAFARQHEATATIVGCRGMGAFKRSVMSMVGLGSVSDYLVHHVQSPVMVVRHPHNEPLPGMDTAVEKPSAPMQSRTVLVSLDDSAHSRSALQFTLDNLMNSRDRLHLVSVALPVPFPMVDESSAAIAALETRQWEETKRNSAARAEQVCKAASEEALAAGVLPQQLFWQYLLPQGGASDVAGSICRYAKDNDVQLVVLGSRGLGSFKRSVMSIMGLGSVSDYCVHHLESPVLIYKAPVEACPQNHPPNSEDALEPQPPTS